jgi:tetratricopeptide (TPR) repeat protein
MSDAIGPLLSELQRQLTLAVDNDPGSLTHAIIGCAIPLRHRLAVHASAGDNVIKLRIQHAMASAMFARGHLSEAMAQYGSAAAQYSQLQLQLPDLAEQLLEHGDLRQQLGMQPEAGALYQEALQVLDNMTSSMGLMEMQVGES